MAFLALGAISAASWALGRFQHGHVGHTAPAPAMTDGQQLDAGAGTPDRPDSEALDKGDDELYTDGDSAQRVSRLRARFDQQGASGRLGHVGATNQLPKSGAPGARFVSTAPGGLDWELLLRVAARLGAQAAAQAALSTKGGACQPVVQEPPVVNLFVSNMASSNADGHTLQALAPADPSRGGSGGQPKADAERQNVSWRANLQRLLLKSLTTVLIWEAAKHQVASRQPEPPLLAALNGVRNSVAPSNKPGILAALLGRKPERRFLGLF